MDPAALSPVVFAGVLGTLAIVVLLACYVPSQDTVRVPPKVALRSEQSRQPHFEFDRVTQGLPRQFLGGNSSNSPHATPTDTSISAHPTARKEKSATYGT